MTLSLNASLGSETLQQLFAITQNEIASGITPDQLMGAARDGSDGLGKRLAAADWSTLSDGLATHLTAFLQDDLVGVFAGCWVKFEELRKCAEESAEDPGGTTEIALAEHEFSWDMSPSVEIRFNGTPLATVPFNLSFVFGVSALELSLKAGAVQAVRAGKCDCRGSIGCGGQTIWTKTLTEVDIPVKLRFKRPISLVPIPPERKA